MRPRPTARPLACAAACAFAVLSPAGARASGLDAPAVGALSSGPLTADPSALWHNPGQLGFLPRPTLFGGLGLVAGQLSITRKRKGPYQSEDTLDFDSPVPPGDLDPSKTGTARAAEAGIVSPAGDLFFAAPLGRSGVTLGAGVYAPYAAVVDLPDDGAQRFAVQDAFIAISHFQGGLGLRVNRHLSLGVGVAYVLGLAEISKVQDFGALRDFGESLAHPPVAQTNDFGPDAPTDVRELAVLARPVKVTDGLAHGVTFNAGVALRPTDALDVGLTYQHGAAMSFDGRFRLDMDDDFFTGDLAHVGLKFEPVVTGKANVRFDLPQRIGAAVGYAVSDRLHLEARATYVRWSALTAFDIRLSSPGLAQPELGLPSTSKVSLPRRWTDTVGLALGGRYALAGAADADPEAGSVTEVTEVPDALDADAAGTPETPAAEPPAPRGLLSVLWLLGYDPPASPDATVDAASPDGQRLTAGAGVELGLTADTALVADARLIAVLPRTVTSSANDLGNGRYSLTLGLVQAHLQMRF